MAFDLNADSSEVEEIRDNFAGRKPDYTELLGATEYIQDEYFEEEDVAAIGNITTYPGGHSTEARRPLSASVDLIFQGEPPEDFGEEYPSWSFAESHFVDYQHLSDVRTQQDRHLEVAMINIDQFPLFDFDEEALYDSEERHLTYRDAFTDHKFEYDIVMAKPEQSVASKFNRLNNAANNREGVIKGSDSIDMASHLHWGHKEDQMDFRRLASLINEKVEPPYQAGIDSAREGKSNFPKGEREELNEAINKLEQLLEE